MVDVFISYSREDEARAQDLARCLEAVGISAWWDRQIPPGKTWDQVIGKALEEARSVVVLWTATSVESNWVKEEAARGARRGVLVPVVFDHVEPPLGFGRIEAAELSDWDGGDRHPELVNLLGAIRDLLGEPPVQKERAAQPLPPGAHKVSRWSTPRAMTVGGAVIALVLGLGVAWWLSLAVTHRLALQIWNVEGQDKGSVVTSRTFSRDARGPLPPVLVEEAGRWIAEAVAPNEAAAADEVAVQVSIPADLDSGELRLQPTPPVPLDTHIYIIRDTGKVRVRSDLNRESLALLEGEFVIEIGAIGYSTVPVRVRKGELLEKTVRLRRIDAKVAIEDVTGPQNDISRRLTEALNAHRGIEIVGPQRLKLLRDEIAASRAAIGVNRVAQIAIRDSLGVDYIVSAAYERQ